MQLHHFYHHCVHGAHLTYHSLKGRAVPSATSVSSGQTLALFSPQTTRSCQVYPMWMRRHSSYMTLGLAHNSRSGIPSVRGIHRPHHFLLFHLVQSSLSPFGHLRFLSQSRFAICPPRILSNQDNEHYQSNRFALASARRDLSIWHIH